MFQCMILAVTAVLVGLDQLTKWLAVMYLRGGSDITVIPKILNFSYAENTGAAFSMFSGQRWMLLAVTIVLLVGLLYALCKNWMQNAFGRMSLRLIISGAIGNMIDRFLLGYVVDLFDFRLINFPVFNVADMAICTGVGLYLLSGFLRQTPEQGKEEC